MTLAILGTASLYFIDYDQKESKSMNAIQLLPRIIVEPKRPATASVIWLHGLGASGHDFEPIVPELGLAEDLPVRFIFPHAPQIPVTINGGYVMPAWYDILEMNFERKIDLAQIMASAKAVHHLIDAEIAQGIDAERIIIAGFSQGGAVAFESALTYPKPLAGLMAMSSYFATHASIKVSEPNRALPIQLFHGIEDDIVDEQMGQNALQTLKQMGYKPSYSTYHMGHAVCPEQIADIGRWITQILSTN
jgi:phospholipase/carboxylesterase